MQPLVDHASCRPKKINTRAAVDSLHDQDRTRALGELSRFRHEFYASLTARADAQFELAEAVLCADGPVTSLVELTLVAEVSPWLRPDAATSPQSVCWNADDTALAATVGGYTGVDSDELGRLG
jgi:hypothetical protein